MDWNLGWPRPESMEKSFVSRSRFDWQLNHSLLGARKVAQPSRLRERATKRVAPLYGRWNNTSPESLSLLGAPGRAGSRKWPSPMTLSAASAGCRSTPLNGTLRFWPASRSSKPPVNVPLAAFSLVCHFVAAGGAVADVEPSVRQTEPRRQRIRSSRPQPGIDEKHRCHRTKGGRAGDGPRRSTAVPAVCVASVSLANRERVRGALDATRRDRLTASTRPPCLRDDRDTAVSDPLLASRFSPPGSFTESLAVSGVCRTFSPPGQRG